MDGKTKYHIMTGLGAFLLHDFSHDGFDYWDNLPNADTSKARKARKERARLLTRKREEELRAQRLSQKNAG